MEFYTVTFKRNKSARFLVSMETDPVKGVQIKAFHTYWKAWWDEVFWIYDLIVNGFNEAENDEWEVLEVTQDEFNELLTKASIR